MMQRNRKFLHRKIIPTHAQIPVAPQGRNGDVELQLQPQPCWSKQDPAWSETLRVLCGGLRRPHSGSGRGLAQFLGLLGQHPNLALHELGLQPRHFLQVLRMHQLLS